MTPVGTLRTQRKDKKLSRKKHTSVHGSTSSKKEQSKRMTKINPKQRTNDTFPRENETVPENINNETRTKPQHKTETNDNAGHTRNQKAVKSKKENRGIGRSTKMENLLKGIRNQETVTTKEIKKEKIEYIMQKYPP